MKQMILLLLWAAASQAVAAGVYKWTDGNGQVHYGERPPASYQAKAMALPKAPISTVDSAQERERALRDIAASNEERARRKEEKAKRNEEQAQAKQEAEQRKQNCSAAKARLHLYQTAGRIFRMDENGQRHYISDQERPGEQRKAQTMVDKWCG